MKICSQNVPVGKIFLLLVFLTVARCSTPERSFPAVVHAQYERTRSSDIRDFVTENPSWVVPKSILVYALLNGGRWRISGSECENALCLGAYMIHWSRGDAATFGLATKALTGVSVVRKIDPTPNQNYLISYDADGLKALFAHVYAYRVRSFGGKSSQLFYDEVVKAWYRSRTSLTRRVLSDREHFLRLAAEYDDKARTDPLFDGTEHTWKIAREYDCLVLGIGKNGSQDGLECDERWIGMLVRRQNDGTLPVVLEILNTVLADFDPEEQGRGAVTL